MIAKDPIDRLADTTPEDHADALSILFVSYGRLPRMKLVDGNEKIVLIEVINHNNDAHVAVKNSVKRFERYAEDVLQSYTSANKVEPHKTSSAAQNLMELLNLIQMRQISGEQFTLVDKNLKSGMIAIMLDAALSKYQQQGPITRNAFNLLSKPELKIIEPWEQASVCHKCPNFEQIIAIHPLRESKCLNCGRKNMTVRIYALDSDYEIHKKRNKDLPLFISCLINRKERGAAVTSKDLGDFQIPGLAGDIDVWIANTFTAIECKLRMQDSKSTDDQLENFSKEVEKDLKKYVKAGAQKLIAVTNLDESDAQNVYKLLNKSFSNIPLRVISKSISDLPKMISDVTDALKRGRI